MLFCTQRSVSALNFDAALEKSGKGVSIFASALDFSPHIFRLLTLQKKREGEIVWGGTSSVPPLRFRGGIPFQSFLASYLQQQPWTTKEAWLTLLILSRSEFETRKNIFLSLLKGEGKVLQSPYFIAHYWKTKIWATTCASGAKN